MSDGYRDVDTDDYDSREDDDWYDDDRDNWEPDPEDGEIARSYEEYYEHCEDKHGGGECHCRPALPLRMWWWAGLKLRNGQYRFRRFTREMHTARIGPFELTARFRPPPRCSACGGEGWFYSKTGIDPKPMPEGYDGVSLCGCGSAIAKLAAARESVRRAEHEPPF